jgi:hypothetical protein
MDLPVLLVIHHPLANIDPVSGIFFKRVEILAAEFIHPDLDSVGLA